MERIPTWIAVVALALTDGNGRLLLQQRLAHKRHGSCWEFPGGKVEQGESPREALVREIAEEIGVTLDPALLEPALFAEEDGAPPIVLNLYTSRQPAGEPVGLDGQEWGWFTPAEARHLKLAPMDRSLLLRLSA